MLDLKDNSLSNTDEKSKEAEDKIEELRELLERQARAEKHPIIWRVEKTIGNMKRSLGPSGRRKIKRQIQRNPKKTIALALAVILTFILAVIFLTIPSGEYHYNVETRGEAAGKGLPEFITDEMVVALFETQTRYGIPVSTGLAMIIAEGGFGNYGPGGEEGRGLSLLSYEHHNLFGIKYWNGMKYATGAVNMLTGEQMECGETYVYDGNFAVFDSYRDAIFKRGWMLMRSPYFEHIEMYLNPRNGSYTVEQANAFMYGIRAGGWATDLEYVEKNIHHMVTFDLYRFDNMTFYEFWYGR